MRGSDGLPARPRRRLALLLVLTLAASGIGVAILAAGKTREARIVLTGARTRVRKCGCQEGRTTVSGEIQIEAGPTKSTSTALLVPEPGGLPERSAWLARTRAREGELLQVDAGDLLFPGAEASPLERGEWRRRAELLVEVSGLMGVQAYVPGELDLALGRKAFDELLGRARFPVVAANLVDATTKKRVFSPSVVVRTSGLSVGIVGIFDPPLPSDDRAQLLAREGLEETDAAAAARVELSALRGEGVDLVVLLAHASDEATCALIHFLGDDAPDVALCAHEAKPGAPISALEGDTMLIARSGSADLEFARVRVGRRRRASNVLRESIRLDARTLREGQDREVVRAIERYKDDLKGLALEPAVVAGLESPLHSAGGFLIGYRTAEGCASCHPRQASVWRASPHAHAWETLEKAGNHADPECVRCHSVGFRLPGGFAEARRARRPAGAGSLDFRNVQCESCHGPRLAHPETKGVGRPPILQTCRECHDAEHDPSFDERRRAAAFDGPRPICARD
ncbi:hypothetical protein HY251_10595 [bacterium]|nr:hypothetical protein [bacterium]